MSDRPGWCEPDGCPIEICGGPHETHVHLNGDLITMRVGQKCTLPGHLEDVCVLKVVLRAQDKNAVEEFKDWVRNSLQPGGPTFRTEFSVTHPGVVVLLFEEVKK